MTVDSPPHAASQQCHTSNSGGSELTSQSLHLDGVASATSRHLALNATLVRATANLESAVVAPLLIPRIGNEPVVLAILSSPAKHLDGMATELIVAGLVVNTTLVGGEIVVHSECCRCTAILHNVSLDCRHTTERVRVSGVDLIRIVASGVARLRAGAQ